MTGLQWIQLSFVDVFGMTNSMMLPAGRFEEVSRVGVAFDGSALEGRARHFESNLRLWPDGATLREVGDGLGRVVCNVRTPQGEPWPGDPRTALQIVVDGLDQLSSGLTISTELEFYVLDLDGEPVDRAGYFDDVGGIGAQVLRAAGDALTARGCEVLSGHHEAGPGQYELDLGRCAPVAAADAIVLAKETIRAACAAFGAVATFMPLPFAGAPGSGLHLHQRSPFLLEPSGELTPNGSSYVAGQLAHASGLCAIAAPTVNSYRRLHAGPEAPGAAIWGHESRAALVRVGTDLGSDASIEFRASDTAANAYLLIAALLVAGAAGISDGLQPGPPSDESIGGYDVGASTQRYVSLPRSLDEALDALQADDVLADAFDSTLLMRLVDGRRVEAEDFRATVSEWERERYSGEL
ncbi:MAG TPA: glutamine synthetase family protein [Acidimicrobiia bacterium]|nr:glutamine synthetase family protein [Acidimicrobiia bacterium]